MSTALISHDVWPQLTKAARACRRGCVVAVAYFGRGAAKLLPLSKGSRLVVDASEAAVRCGQTSPADLLKLLPKATIYSVPNLHAKVFVLGRTAFIGSANVSNRSAGKLVEVMIRTTDPSAVQAARRFVHDLCLHQLTPTILKRLSKVYRPPLIPGGKPGKRRAVITAKRPKLPRLLLAQLELQDWSDRDQAFHDAGVAVARKRRKHPRSFQLDSFRFTGRCRYQRDDVVIQVTDEGGGKVLVSPPANVLYVRGRTDGTRRVSFIYLERPSRRPRPVTALAKQLGRGSLKRLRRDGIIRDASFAQALLNLWAT